MPSRDFAAFDPLTILTRLREVEYVLVGGFAAVLYGAPTSTGDLDILPDPVEANVLKLAAALVSLHARVREPRSSRRRIDVTAELLREAAAAANFAGQLRTITDAGPLDILWSLHDGRGYRDLVERSLVLTEDDLRIRVIGLEDLIEVKGAAGRAQDQLVLPYLRRIRDQGDP